MSFDFTWYLLSFKGRISRQEFWLGYVGLIVVLLLVRRPLTDISIHFLRPVGRPWQRDELDVALWIPIVVIATIALWPFCAIYAKRLHDLNISGWWQLALPVMTIIENTTQLDGWNAVVLAVIAVFGLLPGSRGSNRFGDDPLVPARP
jgi:uncharacterized membrane protein YhaH (DUF805 family)